MKVMVAAAKTGMEGFEDADLLDRLRRRSGIVPGSWDCPWEEVDARRRQLIRPDGCDRRATRGDLRARTSDGAARPIPNYQAVNALAAGDDLGREAGVDA